jgi:hypothetical protein
MAKQKNSIQTADWQERLKKLTMIELKAMFPIARELNRELYFFLRADQQR